MTDTYTPGADPYGLQGGTAALGPQAQAAVDAAGPTGAGIPGAVGPEIDPETGEPIAPEYDTRQQEIEGVQEEEVNIRKEAEHDRAFKLLVEAGVGVKNILAAEAYYKQESGLPPEDQIDGTELIIAVANGLPGHDQDPQTGEIRTKALISDKNLSEVIDRINAPTKEEGSEELAELNPRKRPDHDADVGMRYEDTRDFLKYFKNTFREDDEVLSAVTNVLEVSGNYQLIKELGLEKFQKNPTPAGETSNEPVTPGEALGRWQPGDPVTGQPAEVSRYGGAEAGDGAAPTLERNLSPEDIMRAITRPEAEGAGSAVGERLRDYGRQASEFAEGTVERGEAEATGFGSDVREAARRVTGRARAEADTRARKTQFREERERAGSPSFVEVEQSAEGGPPDLFDLDESPFPRDQRRTERKVAGYGLDGIESLKEGVRRVRRDFTPGQPTSRADAVARYRGKKKPSDKDYDEEEPTNEKFLEEAGGNAVLDNAWGEAFLSEYRSGRYAASSNNPLRDPKGVIEPIQKKNHSPDLDKKMGEDYYTGKIRNPWNKFMNDSIAIGKADSEALATRGLKPGTPLWNRAVYDLQYAAGEQAKEILFAGVDNQFSRDEAGIARVKYFTDIEKPPQPRRPRSEQRSSFSNESGMFSGLFRGLKGGVNAYLNEANRVTSTMDEAYGTALDAGKMWQELDADDRKEIQFGAYLANAYGDDIGFFTKDPAEGGALDPFQIMNGDVNDTTAFAYWNQMVQEAAMTAAMGSPLTPGEITRRAIDKAKAQLESHWGATSTEIAKVINVSLTDPNAIAHDTRVLGQTLLGRDPSEEDFRALVGLIHSRERDSQIKAARAGAEAEAQRRQEISAYQRSQFELLEDQFDDPSSFTSFDDPLSAATFGHVKPTVQNRIDNLNKLATPDPEGMLPLQRNTPRSGGGMAEPGHPAPPSSAAPFQASSPTGGGGETISESTEFNAQAAIEAYFRRNYGQEIDANTMQGFFSSFGDLLRSPIQGV